jgi:hypothetical protein
LKNQLPDYPIPQSTLALFVFRVFADHPHHALAADDLALVANLFD